MGTVIFTMAFSQGRQVKLQQKEKRTFIQEMMKDREAWHVAIHGVAKSDYNVATKQQQLCCSVQLVAQSCPTLCDPMDCSTSGLPIHHQLPEFTQTHVH